MDTILMRRKHRYQMIIMICVNIRTCGTRLLRGTPATGDDALSGRRIRLAAGRYIMKGHIIAFLADDVE